MQKCGQLHASIAVALMAQSAAGEAVWPADTPSRAITISNGTLCIRDTSFWGGIIRLKRGFGKANRDIIDVARQAQGDRSWLAREGDLRLQVLQCILADMLPTAVSHDQQFRRRHAP